MSEPTEARLRVQAARDLLQHVLDGDVPLDDVATGVWEHLQRAQAFEARVA